MRSASRTCFALTLAGALFMVSCPHGNKKTSSSMDTSGASTPLETGVVVLDNGRNTVRVKVELARTPQQRARGLMYREKLAAESGMLFLFDQEEIQRFWMQNTYIPLDMLFINANKVVVGIIENAEPMTTTSRRVRQPSRYVLEVNGGFCRSKEIAIGAKVRFEGF